MKKILIVATGGTIGSSLCEGCRRLTPDLASSILFEKYFRNGGTVKAEELLDSGFEEKTLSENMTPEKLMKIAEHIRSFDLSLFSGVIVLHGTDTLDYTATLFSMLFCNVPVPVILVSGNRPPEDEKSNASANFSAAVSLIENGVAPNVYVTYRNSDGKTRLYVGSRLLGCGDFSEDFFAAEGKGVFTLDENRMLSENDTVQVNGFSKERPVRLGGIMENIRTLNSKVLLIKAHVGLDYGLISLEGIDAVVHGTYHSGTLCVDGGDEKYSAIAFFRRCKEKGIPVYLAPCKLDEEQYETAFAAADRGMIPVYTSTAAAYWMLSLALSAGLKGEDLTDFISCFSFRED